MHFAFSEPSAMSVASPASLYILYVLLVSDEKLDFPTIGDFAACMKMEMLHVA